jgi:hypothetical protein
MDETIELIEDFRDKLRAAFKQAEGNLAAQEKILKELGELADLQARIELGALIKQAAILNALSDIIDGAIAAIKHNVDNFLLNDFLNFKNKVDKKAGKPASPLPQTPSTPSIPSTPSTPSGPATPATPSSPGAGTTPGTPAARPTGPGPAILGLAPNGQRHVNGPVVMALQLALGRAGQAIEPDGDFGSITVEALRRWQAANGFTQADSIDAAQWRKLTNLNTPSIFDLCLDVTSDYEGTSFDRVVGNFDGAGITFGLIGFTLVNGEIKKLLTAIETLQKGSVSSAFGALFPRLMEVLDLPKNERLAWADSISLGAKKYDVAQPWKDAFLRLGRLPAARKAQIDRAYDVYWKVAKRHIADFMAGKPLTDRDAALWYDTAVQNSIDDDDREELKTIAASGLTGRNLREAFAKAIAAGSSPQWRKDVLSRKMSFADGTGGVHGSSYGLDVWGLTGASISLADLDAPSAIAELVSTGTTGTNFDRLEPDDESGEAESIGGPAVITTPLPGASVHAGWALYEKYVTFIAGLGLRNFTPDELLFLGGQNSSGKCANLNNHPPEELWANIAPTAAVLDKLRTDLAFPIHILSAYRAPAYNRCIDGSATNSFHMRYQAIDFVCDKGTPGDWAATLKDYRVRGIFKGGIGVYRTFVHVDTRGVNADWTG